MIGNSGVGKSCLSVKATKDVFENNYLATVGFEFFSFNVRVDDSVIKLQIWDTCGQEIYRSLITTCLKEIKTNSNPDVKIFLIGNKADLEET